MAGNCSILGFVRTALLLALCLGAAGASADPPWRIGRLSAIEGGISLYDRDGGEWLPVAANWPLTSGDTLWAGPGSRADIRIGSLVLRIDGSTELEFVRLDDAAIDVRLQQGSIALRADDPGMAQQFRLESEQGHTTLIEPGRYRFDVGDFTTTATAYRGQIGFEGSGQAYIVMSGQRAEFWYSGTLDMRVSDARRDDFFDWVMARDQFEDRWRGPRYVSTGMTGYEDLDLYGDWHDSDDFGAMWTPRLVPIGWSPYRLGRWALIPPWGWTWIDEAPWGFAPFHYGRWVFWRGRWAWLPGALDARPVYAPALVAWIGQPGTSPLMLGGAAGVGWFPLGPRETYIPPYRASDRYLHDINRPHHADIEHGDDARRDYVNRHLPQAITVVPVGVMTGGRPVGKAFDGRVDMHAIAALPVSRDAPLHLQPPARADRRDREGQQGFRASEPPALVKPMHGGALRPADAPLGPALLRPQAPLVVPPSGEAKAAISKEPRRAPSRTEPRKKSPSASPPAKSQHDAQDTGPKQQEHRHEAANPQVAAPPQPQVKPQHGRDRIGDHRKEPGREAPAAK